MILDRFFFFQAEDGIRDLTVTGVQTCALPISPETPLYTKGNLLYAADLARPAIQAKNRALLVEGYVDCLMAHQHGFTETVAALGTAFTPAQLGLLNRYCDEAVLFFDADAAGSRAAERAEELLEP